MKSFQLIVKALIIITLFSQNYAQANWFSDFFSNTWKNHKPSILVVGLAALGFASYTYYNSFKKQAPILRPVTIENHAKPLFADVYSLTQAIIQMKKYNKIPGAMLEAFAQNPFIKATQQEFIKHLDSRSLIYLPADIFLAECHKFLGLLNIFFQDNNLPRTSAWESGYGIGSIIHMNLNWHKKASETFIEINNNKYKALKINQDCYAYLDGDRQNPNESPIFEIMLPNDDKKVYIQQIPKNKKFLNSMDLMDYVCSLDRSILLGYVKNKAALTLPCIDINNQENDISWLCGMKLGSTTVGRAQQYINFKIDAGEMQLKLRPAKPVERDSENHERKEYVINDNCVIWVKGHGAIKPLFAAFIPTTTWQKN